jgi:hypothetical protein
MKRKPALHKIAYRGPAEIKSRLDDRAIALMKAAGIQRLTEARGLILAADANWQVPDVMTRQN